MAKKHEYEYLWMIEEELLVRCDIDSGSMERYHPRLRKWIFDESLSIIYTGDVRTHSLTEEEAWEKMNSLK